MTTRKYDFVTGIETSAAPAASDPSAPGDPVTLGYAEDNFVQGGETLATITALKALATADVSEGDIRFVKDQNVAFWYSASSTATGDDYFYLTPASTTGRWIRVTDMAHATGNLTVPGSLTVTGDMTVNGTTTTINTATLDIEDANIIVNNGGNQSAANSAGAGITVEMSDATHAALSYDSTLTSKWKAGNIGSQSEIITDAGNQSFSGIKSFTAAPNVDPAITFAEQGSPPATPAAGKRKVYATSTGFSQIDSAGLVSDLGGSGGGSGSGEINVIADANTASGWTATGAGITVATSVTSSELPLDGIILSGIKITPVSGTTDYVRYRFTMPEGLFNTKLKLSWYQEALSGYASGDLKAEVHTNTASDYTGTDAKLDLSTDASGVSAIPNAKGQFVSSFDSNSSLYYELRFYRTAGTTAVVLQNVIVGPGSILQGSVVSPWTAYTPVTAGLGTPTSVDVSYMRVGAGARIRGVLTTGTVSGTAAEIRLPTGLTIGVESGSKIVGRWNQYVATGTTRKGGPLIAEGSGSDGIRFTSDDYTTASSPASDLSGNVITANTTTLTFDLFVSIAEWSGGGTVNLAANSVDYAFSTEAFDQTGTTTSYGPQGQVTANLAGTLKAKTITWPTPTQVGDEQSIELSHDRITWFDSALYAPYRQNDAGSNIYGVLITASTATTTSVQFNGYRIGATDDSPQTDWGTSLYWRIKRIKGGQAVGFGIASSGNSGLIPYYNTESGSLNNDFTGGTYTTTRIGNVVTITIKAGTHASSAGVTSTVGVPSWALPTGSDARNVYTAFQGSFTGILEATTAGNLVTRYYASNGTTTTRTDIGYSGTLTYNV